MSWTEALYNRLVAPYVDSSLGFQPDHKLNRLSARKVSAAAGYPALLYPWPLSPGSACAFDTDSVAEWPLFGGEAFGDVSWVDVTNQRTRHLNMLSLLELLENGADFAARHPAGLSHVAVNIGANDGVCRVGHGLDPANCLAATGYGGVFVEADERVWPELQRSLGARAPDVQLLLEAAHPDTVATQLSAALARRPGATPTAADEVDLVKVDVDGPDCEMVEALHAAGWRPKVWHVEVNPLFPPDMAVWAKTDVRAASAAFANASAASGGGGGRLASGFSRAAARSVSEEQQGEAEEASAASALVGCSLGALLGVLGTAYRLLHVEFENAVLVRADLSGALEPWLSRQGNDEKWRLGYFCHPLARVRLPGDADRASSFLRYDFRRWGDFSRLRSDVRQDIRDFLVDLGGDSHELRDDAWTSPAMVARQGAGSSTGATIDADGVGGDRRAALRDPDCMEAGIGGVLEWPLVLSNIERVLESWATADGKLEVTLMVLAEGIVEKFDIDRAWPIFKMVAGSECPLGGIAVAAVLAWRCRSGVWEDDPLAPKTAQLFLAMRHQLPLIGEPGPLRKDVGRPAGIGCEAMLDRYLDAALRRVDLASAMRSRWPIFELLSALHTKSVAWPRGYP
eukprot:TRINITY_DN18619_c0_g1_i2.p1 TRINITY_DN18619_c0_g1~~TRINITY_DN18619_c0_g1_i2.p1  ORF type:complete len:730 (-),score=142.69 TRINITY_DN18619_c0_g1_i2:64-1944(-)